MLPDGNESMPLDDGRAARLITRVDYRTMAAKPVTEQRAADKWDKRKRDLPGLSNSVMRDVMGQFEKSETTAGHIQVNV